MTQEQAAILLDMADEWERAAAELRNRVTAERAAAIKLENAR